VFPAGRHYTFNIASIISPSEANKIKERIIWFGTGKLLIKRV